MSGLAVRSLRHRPTAGAATFFVVLLGTALAGAFATLLETALGPVGDADAETLVTMASVIGGWGALIVLFSVVSTVGITVAQRATEQRVLRVVGATPRQVRRLVRLETVAIAAVAGTLGAVLALPAGLGLLALLRGGLISAEVGFGGTLRSPALTAFVLLAVATLAASIAARRATPDLATPGAAGTAAVVGSGAGAGLRWWRWLIAALLLAHGIAMAIVTITVTADDPDPFAAMQTSGSLSIVVAIALAVLAPPVLRFGATVLGPFLAATSTRGAAGERAGAGWLAATGLRRRPRLLGGVLGPVIVLASASVGTLLLVSIDGRSRDAADLAAVGMTTTQADSITLLNHVVVGMIALFAAAMAANAVVASLAGRGAEVRRLRLLGATAPQLRRMLLAEAAVVGVVGAGAGAVASLFTVVPFSVARGEGLVPDGGLWLAPVVLALAVALPVLVTRLRLPALARATR